MKPKNTQVATPRGGVHVRHIVQTTEERQQHAKEFREQKTHEQKIKEERFEKIHARRKNRAPGSRGINIDVTGNK